MNEENGQTHRGLFTKRFRRIVLFLVAMCMLLGWWLWATTEPVYAGRELSTWVEQLGDESPEVQEEAQDAIRIIGTEGLPHLLKIIGTEDSRFKQFLNDLGRRHRWLRVRLARAEEQQEHAAAAIALLGPSAESAIPDLKKLLNDPETAPFAAKALVGIGPDAIAPLEGALTSTNVKVRLAAGLGLGHLGPQAEASVPELAAALDDTDHRMRARAVWALAQIEQDSGELRELLQPMRNDPHPVVAKAANAVLQKFEEEEADEVEGEEDTGE